MYLVASGHEVAGLKRHHMNADGIQRVLYEVVQYVDAGNDMFQSFPLRKNLEQLELRICDAKSRSLAQLDPFQADNGLMAWKAVLRFDLFKPPPSRTGKPVGQIVTSHPPEL